MVDFGAPTQLTHDDLIDVLVRNFEPHWLAGLLADPSSLSIFEGMIAVMLRLQDSIDENLFRGAFIIGSQGAASATSTVRLQRPSGVAGTIYTTNRFIDERGAIWRPTVDYVVAPSGGVQTIDVPITTERQGYWLNSFEPLTYTIFDDLFDSSFFTILGADEAVGGRAAYLDQHGKERKRFRSSGEDDVTYRNRIRFVEDVVSPAAIARIPVQVLDAFADFRTIVDLIVLHGLISVLEPFIDSAQPSVVGLGGRDVPFWDDTMLFYDDPHGALFRDIVDGDAFFDVVMPTPVDPTDGRMFYDDDTGDPGFFLDDPLLAYFDLDAPLALTAPVAALADELDRKRAGGVGGRIYVGGSQLLSRHPGLGSLVQAGGWATEAGGVTDVALTTAIATFDGDTSYVAVATGAGAGTALQAGDLVFSLPAVPAPLSVSHVVVRAWIRRASLGVGTNPQVAFLVRATPAGAPLRALVDSAPFTIDHDEWRPYRCIIERNPTTSAAWTLADIAGVVGVGVANVAAVGATDQVRVSELRLEIVANYG